MITQQALDFIKKQLGEGKSREEIRTALLGGGWQVEHIDVAFKQVDAVSGEVSTTVAASQDLPGPIALLKEAWAIYTQRWAAYSGIMIYPLLFLIPFFLVVAFGASSTILLEKAFAFDAFVVLLLPLVLVFALLTLFVQGWAQVALIYAAKDREEGIGVKQAYQRAMGKVIPYWWVAFLTGLIVMGGLLLFIVPGIIFISSFSLAMFVLVVEDIRGMDALLKSREYVKGLRGKVLGRLIFAGLIYLVVSILLSILSSVANLSLLDSILSPIANLVIGPVITIYVYLMYVHIKRIKGDVPLTPQKGEKAKFIAVGILGIILIPAILVGIVLTSLSSSRSTALDAQRKAQLSSFRSFLEVYYDQHGVYPPSLKQLNESSSSTPGNTFRIDPYEYTLGENGEDYELCTILVKTGRTCVSGSGSPSQF